MDFESIESTFQEDEERIFQSISTMGHEQVVFCYDKAIGLKSIIALHNTVLGPALGGVRMWNYDNDREALTDVLRLSRGMTFKNALAGLNAGGGKAVIIADPRKAKSEALFRRFGKFVESLNGKYVTAEDVSMKPSDMEYIAMETRHATGLSESMGGLGGPSPVTAYGTYLGMKAAVKKAFGTDSLEGRSVAIQGAGHVGQSLVDYLTKENAQVFITDIYEDKLQEISKTHQVNVVDPNDIYQINVDIFSPNALGAVLNSDTIPQLNCNIIAGAANNQLEDESLHGQMLHEKGILYAPDFMVNAGGVINVFMEYQGGKTVEMSFKKAEKIYDTSLEVLTYAEEQNIMPQQAAMHLAEKRIKEMGNLKLSFSSNR